MILTFEDKMSGVRCNLPEDLDVPHKMEWFNYNECPEWVHNDLWFVVNGLDVSILKREDGHFDMQPSKYIGDAVGKIYDVRVDEKMLAMCNASVGMDDQVKIWLYYNRKDLFDELVEKFGTIERVWNYYIRFNH
jgi:hypothetical protein